MIGVEPQLSAVGGACKTQQLQLQSRTKKLPRYKATGFSLQYRRHCLVNLHLGQSTMEKPLECSHLQQHNGTKLSYGTGSAIVFRSKKAGPPPSEFPPKTLCHICCCIQQYLHILSAPAFNDLKSSLNARTTVTVV